MTTENRLSEHDFRAAATRLAVYVEALRRSGELDTLPRYHLEAIDDYLADFRQARR